MKCAECGTSLTWSGMGWSECSDLQHEGLRLLLLSRLQRAVLGRIAVQSGHEVSIRFSATQARTDCLCGWSSGPQFNGYWGGTAMTNANFFGIEHLILRGRMIVLRGESC